VAVRGGSRTSARHAPYVTYRFLIHKAATIAINATDHCTLLHAGGVPLLGTISLPFGHVGRVSQDPAQHPNYRIVSFSETELSNVPAGEDERGAKFVMTTLKIGGHTRSVGLRGENSLRVLQGDADFTGESATEFFPVVAFASEHLGHVEP
jgi:hypothetical protein